MLLALEAMFLALVLEAMFLALALQVKSLLKSLAVLTANSYNNKVLTEDDACH